MGRVSRRQILVVEDDADLQAALAGALRDEGYEVLDLSNGHEALARLKSDEPPPALLFLDLMLPIMSGWELLAAIAAEPRLAKVPVCVVSAVARSAPLPGVVRALQKPPKLHDILELARRYCAAPSPPPPSP